MGHYPAKDETIHDGNLKIRYAHSSRIMPSVPRQGIVKRHRTFTKARR